MQYQQNTCLHRRHIIWAQPASRSIGTRHIGHRLMYSVLTISCVPYSSHVRPGCHVAWHPLQNCVTHVGHVTGDTCAWPAAGHTWQMVWQSGAGHQVLDVSRVTSVLSLNIRCLSTRSLSTSWYNWLTLTTPWHTTNISQYLQIFLWKLTLFWHWGSGHEIS